MCLKPRTAGLIIETSQKMGKLQKQGNSIYFLEWQIRPLRKAKKLLGFSLTQKKPTIFRVARLVQGWFDAAS